MNTELLNKWHKITDFFEMIDFAIENKLDIQCDYQWVYIQTEDGEVGGREVQLDLHDAMQKYLELIL